MSKEKYSGPKVTNTETFIRKARWVHGDKYDYSLVTYSRSQDKVSIICPIHGEFDQAPNKHTQGRGCRYCANNQIKTTEQFIKEVKEIHGNVYDYSKTIYQTSHTPTIVSCRIHGDFKVSPSNHLFGRCGCPACRGSKMSSSLMKDTKWFIERAEKRHPNVFDYTNSEYNGTKEPIEIICREHGSFWQTPNNHLQGAGCPICATNKTSWQRHGYYSTNLPSNLYIFKMKNDFIKVGLSKNVNRRLCEMKLHVGYRPEIIYTMPGQADVLFELEQRILRESALKQRTFEEPFSGSTECLELSELPKVLQIIEDWEKSNEESFSRNFLTPSP